MRRKDSAEKRNDREEMSIYNKNFPSHSNKGILTTSGAAGTFYQVKILMLYALEAARSEKPFYLYTETQGQGKFDDCVLYREDKMQVIQVKHSYNPEGEYHLGHLIGSGNEESGKAKDNKKAALSRYFDSWLIIESRRQNNPSENKKVVEYLFVTNHRLSVTDGIDGLYNHSTHRFHISDFIDDKQQEHARKSILESIYIHLQGVQDEIKKACKDFVELFNKESLNAHPGRMHIPAKKVSTKLKIVFALLRKHQCIKEYPDEKYNNACLYKFTKKIISKSTSDELPTVIQYLRCLLSESDPFNDESKWKGFCFYTVESNFHDLSVLNYSSSSLKGDFPVSMREGKIIFFHAQGLTGFFAKFCNFKLMSTAPLNEAYKPCDRLFNISTSSMSTPPVPQKK